MDGRIEINITQSSDPQRSYVVKCATLKCSFGDSESKLQTPDRKMACINGIHQGNIMDFKPMVNIMPFGMCSSLANPTVAAATAANYGRLQKMPCIPAVTMPWINGKGSVMVDSFPALLNISQNMCLYSGVIKIQNDGQAASMPAITPNMDRVGVGVQKAANGGLLMAIGLGALATGLVILTAPISVPLLITAAAVGTVAAGGACVLMGGADIVEGGQDVAYGSVGSNQHAFNPIKDTVFMGNDEAYYGTEMVVSTAAILGEATIAPYTLAVTGGEIGAEKVMTDKLASEKAATEETMVAEAESNAIAGKNVTAASKVQVEKPPESAVQSAKQTQNAGTKPVVEKKPAITGETSSTKVGKQVHKQNADARRKAGGYDTVNEPLKDKDGKVIEVPKRVDSKTGEPSAKTQKAIPDAVKGPPDGEIIDDKPLGRPISKDRQELRRNCEAYEVKYGEPPKKVIIERYDPATGAPAGTEVYDPSKF